MVSLATLVGVGVAIAQFRRLRIQRNVDDALNLVAAAHEHWAKLHQHSFTPSKRFYLGSLLSFYEVVCFSYNKKLLGSSARGVIRQHLLGALEIIAYNDIYSGDLLEMKTLPNTFEDIVNFLRRENARPELIGKYGCFSQPWRSAGGENPQVGGAGK